MNYNAVPRFYLWALVFGSCTFLAWALNLFGRVGAISPDEIMVVIRAMEGIGEIGRGDFSILAPREWMVLLYAGNLKILAMLPVFAVFKPSVGLMHVVWSFTGTFCVWMIFWTVGWLRNWFEGLVCALLMCVNFYFVSCAMLAADYEEVFIMAAFWAALFFAVLYARRRRTFFILVSGFMLGIGVWIKVMFFAYLVGLFAVFVLWNKPLRGVLTAKAVLFLFAGFCFGSFPYWIGAVVQNSTLLDLAGSSFSGEKGELNRAVFANILMRLQHLWAVLSGSYQMGFCAVKFLPDIAWGLLVFLGGWYVFFTRSLKSKLVFKAGLCVCIVVFIMSLFVPSWHDASHLFILMPFPQMLFAGLCTQLIKDKRRVMQVCCVCLLAFHLFLQVSKFWQVETKIRQGRAAGLRDYELVFDYFKANGVNESVWLLSETFFCSVRYGDMTRGVKSHMPFDADFKEYVDREIEVDKFYLVNGVPGRDIENISMILEQKGYAVKFEKKWERSKSGCLLNIYRVSKQPKVMS